MLYFLLSLFKVGYTLKLLEYQTTVRKHWCRKDSLSLVCFWPPIRLMLCSKPTTFTSDSFSSWSNFYASRLTKIKVMLCVFMVCWSSRKLSDLMFLLYCRGGLRVRHRSWKKGSENSERATGVRLSPITPSRIEQISTLRTGGVHWKSQKWSRRTPKGQSTFSFFLWPVFVHLKW